MKYIIFLALGLFVSTSQAADRCAGQVSKELIESESVANMYFDVGIHQVICNIVGTPEQKLKSDEDLVAVRTKYRTCIISSQDAMVAHLGGEDKFENFYAAVGNQISLINLPNPCQRVTMLRELMLSSNYSCRRGIAKAYKKHGDFIIAKYKEKGTGRLFRRICDPAN